MLWFFVISQNCHFLSDAETKELMVSNEFHMESFCLAAVDKQATFVMGARVMNEFHVKMVCKCNSGHGALSMLQSNRVIGIHFLPVAKQLVQCCDWCFLLVLLGNCITQFVAAGNELQM